MPDLATEQRTGFSILKGHRAELSAGGRHNLLRQTGVDLGRAGLMAAFQMQGWLWDSISGTSFLICKLWEKNLQTF